MFLSVVLSVEGTDTLMASFVIMFVGLTFHFVALCRWWLLVVVVMA
jgi:hypothetical protein